MKTLIKSILPFPLLSLSLLLLWLLLQQSVGLGQIIVGVIVALFAGRALAALQPDRPTIRKPLKIIELMALVTVDVLRSNLAVARIVMEGRQGDHTAAFITLPLELTDRSALAILSCILTATPGSAWLEYDPTRKTVLIHVLDLVEEQTWIDTIKNRYERLLLEIFT